TPMRPDPAHARPAADPVTALRARVDTLDTRLIEILRQRLTASEEIQRIRTDGGGSRLDPRREERVRGRYADAFGPGGDEIAAAVLRLCRGAALR
ncbi:chorismate mutase, partial [Streptomyces sp. CC53]|uniref:chorismate mutase n=2 Tax=unclassified Streptomyces TaxID=2593676 RepID=UPI0009A1192F